MSKITVINVRVRERNGIFHASCKDLPGLHVCGKRLASVMADVPEVIEKLYKLNEGLDVKVTAAATAKFRVPSSPTSFLASRTKAEAVHA